MVFGGENTLSPSAPFALVYTCCWQECPKQHDALFLYIYYVMETPLRRVFPYNPFPTLLHAHRLVTLKPVNLFNALYCSKPLPVPAIRARYACWAAKPRFCHFERAWCRLVRAIRVQNLRAWYNLRRHRGVWGRGSRNSPALLLLLVSKVSPSGRTRQQEIFYQQPMRHYIGTTPKK